MNAGAFQKKTGVSRETIERLELYAAELMKWNARINLISSTTTDMIWSRHFLDSAQILDLAPKGVRRWADLGSGGGFPGLVIATIAKETHPDMQMVCIESDRRKAVFLQTVSRMLGLNVDVINERIEHAPKQNADLVSARALAPLPRLLELAYRHLSTSGISLFLKGFQYSDEVSDAEKHWMFDMQCIPSKTDPNGVILKIGDLSRA